VPGAGRGHPGSVRRATIRACARWCCTRPASRSGSRTRPSPSPGRDRCGCGCWPAASAAPTSTSSTASSGRENLCERALFTGYDLDGGYAEYAVADERFCFPVPDGYPDLQAAPLLCAGLIGYRSLRLAGDAERLGLYGFGASAHIVAQVARHEGRRLFGFVRPGDEDARRFALELGCEWAGASDELPPEELDAAILFAPVGALVPAALRALARGGVAVCAGIHMSDLPSFPYELLWHERAVRSVANLTRRDGEEFLALAPQVPVRTEIEEFPLERANEALDRLRAGEVRGAAVLRI
jgi:propanol-preferring alcohol dehydrogenase